MNRQNAGFTLVEVLIVTVISLVVLLSVYQLFISQSRLFATQNAVIDSRSTSRRVGTLLSSELRNVSAAGGDLYVIAQDSVVLRSYQSTATMCSGTTPFSGARYLGLRNIDGNVAADSARVYSVTNNSWSSYNVTDAYQGTDVWTTGQSPVCFWGDSTTTEPRPQSAIKLAGPVASLAAIGVGAPVRVFQRIKYGLYPRTGRWYFGRQVGGGAWESLMGPMLSPNNGGLSFTYYDVDSVVTTDPTLVSHVELSLRSESVGQVSPLGNTGGTKSDALSMTIYLRNN